MQDLPGALSGTYFCDDDRDGVDDGNANGDKDVAGKTVTLLLADGVTPATDIDGNPVASVQTDQNGNYRFDNLAAGDYVVMFEDSSAEGKSFIAPNVGDNGTTDAADDSDVIDAANGKTAPVTVVAGQETENVDAGVQNLPPSADDESGEVCYDETVTIDLVDVNDIDPEGAPLNLIAIDGIDVSGLASGDSITLDNGVIITLGTDGEITVDGEDATVGGTATADLLAGESAVDTFTYTISDGNGGTDTANVEVSFKGATDTLAKIAQVLPDQLYFTIADIPADAPQDQIDAFFQLTLNTDDPDFAFLDNLLIDDAYCVDISKPFTVEEKVVADVTILADGFVDASQLPAAAFDHFDEINWVLNNRDHVALQGFNDGEIQGAIWGLTNDNTFVDDPFFGSTANAIAAQAIIEDLGDGFELSFGDKVAVLLDPVSNDPSFQTEQPFVVALDNFWEDCIC